MAGDDMAAEFVADLQRALEVQPARLRPHAARGAARVSAETSTANQSSPLSTTVRQTPEQAIEAPRSTLRHVVGAGDRARAGRRAARRIRSCPMSVTIPVNMMVWTPIRNITGRARRLRAGRCQAAARRAASGHARRRARRGRSRRTPACPRRSGSARGRSAAGRPDRRRGRPRPSPRRLRPAGR